MFRSRKTSVSLVFKTLYRRLYFILFVFFPLLRNDALPGRFGKRRDVVVYSAPQYTIS